MGNAVSPCVAAALGRCLLLAAVAEAPADVDHAVLAVPDPELLQVSLEQSLMTCTTCCCLCDMFYQIQQDLSVSPLTESWVRMAVASVLLLC